MSEAGLEPMVAVDLAGDVADDAAEIGLELAQSPVGALELLGMGVTLMLDQGELADPRIGLPQLHAQLFGQLHQLLAGPVQQLGVGREGNVLRLHRGVDNDARELRRLHRAGLGRDRQALLQQRLQPLLAHAVAPVGHRGAIERQPVLEKLLAAEVLVIRVLDPPLAHHFVAEIVGVLENREPRHQPGRQRRPAGAVGVNRAELLFQKSPVDRPRQLRQRVVHVDDLVEPRTKQILLAAFPPLPWPHRTLRQSRVRVENHGLRFEGIPNLNLQENRRRNPNFRQIQSQQFQQFLLPVNRFGIFHGRLCTPSGSRWLHDAIPRKPTSNRRMAHASFEP